MNKTITLKNKGISTTLEYTLKISKRSRGMRIAIHYNGDVVVTIPRIMNFDFLVGKFISRKSKWIFEKLEHFELLKQKYLAANPQGDYVNIKKTKAERRNEYLKYRDRARVLAESKVTKFGGIYNFKFNQIRIKNQKTRWGSCSKKGNLNFNYKIALIPEKLADYIVIHELCHLGELNHSKKFWNLVSKAMPDYNESKKKLNDIGVMYQ